MEIRIAKGDFTRQVEVDFDALPAVSQTAIVTIGFRNMPKLDEGDWERDGDAICATVPAGELIAAGLASMLNDAHAAIKAEAENMPALVNALVDKKLEALREGKLRVSGPRATDAVGVRAMDIARRKVDAAAKKVGKELTAQEISAQARELVKSNPVWKQIAESQLRLEAETGDIEI